MPPKIDNNTLVLNAIAKQIDITEEFKTIWNKLDHDLIIADLGVPNKLAGYKRYKRWVDCVVEQGAQFHGDVAGTADNAVKVEPTTKVGIEKPTRQPSKNKIKKEGSTDEAEKKKVGKKGVVGKINKM